MYIYLQINDLQKVRARQRKSSKTDLTHCLRSYIRKRFVRLRIFFGEKFNKILFQFLKLNLIQKFTTFIVKFALRGTNFRYFWIIN